MVTGCVSFPVSPPNDTISIPNTYAEAHFETWLTKPLPTQSSLFLEVIDDVNGWSVLNSMRYPMQPDPSFPLHYQLNYPIPVGSLIKYRYIYSQSDGIIHTENVLAKTPFRYRTAFVPNSLTISDTIFGWIDDPYLGPRGTLSGQISSDSGNTVGNLFVTAAGLTTQTASDGSFILTNLPVGEHNLVVYSPNGAYRPFQQRAIIAANAITPAQILVSPQPLVKVIFRVTCPQPTAGLPIRIISNLEGMGNSFADISNGFSGIASHAPLMVYQPDGSYSITLNLPAGLDFRYKYSLGDGFWNAEHTEQGILRTRQIIIPTKGGFVQDNVEAWGDPTAQPIKFFVQTPPETPATDIISIQFNAFGWTPPIPMWKTSENTWYYLLHTPWTNTTILHYRYCRNDQCGIADDLQTAGIIATNRSLEPGVFEYQDTITNWVGLPKQKTPTSISAGEIHPRGNTFIAGVEYQSTYSPLWSPYQTIALQNIRDLNANWVIIPSPWQYTNINPVSLEPIMGYTPSQHEITNTVQQAKAKQLNIAIYPTSLPAIQTNTFWTKAPINEDWLENWQNAYRRMILSHAYLATQNQIGLLILGEPYLGLPDSPMIDKETYWEQLIKDIRNVYSGKIALAIPIIEQGLIVPTWSNQVDMLYVLWSLPLGYNFPEMQAQATQIINTWLMPAYQSTGKPIIIAISYPSIDGAAAQGCVRVETSCYPFEILDQPMPSSSELKEDMQEQLDAYSAVLNSLQPYDWIQGFVSRGYYPPAQMQDKSASIHGKPAADALWFWYARLLAQYNP
jgi:hypothetical protein